MRKVDHEECPMHEKGGPRGLPVIELVLELISELSSSRLLEPGSGGTAAELC